MNIHMHINVQVFVMNIHMHINVQVLYFSIYIIMIQVFLLFLEAAIVDVYDIDPEFIPTPNGHSYWVPDVPVDEKPKRGTRFNTFEEAVNMYKVYAAKARFGVRKSGTKKWRGEVTHKHVICNRGGKPRKIVETNTLNDDVNQHAQEDDNIDGKKKET